MIETEPVRDARERRGEHYAGSVVRPSDLFQGVMVVDCHHDIIDDDFDRAFVGDVVSFVGCACAFADTVRVLDDLAVLEIGGIGGGMEVEAGGPSCGGPCGGTACGRFVCGFMVNGWFSMTVFGLSSASRIRATRPGRS